MNKNYLKEVKNQLLKNNLKNLGFKHNLILDEFIKESIDKSLNGNARFELKNSKDNRVGKLYWDKIVIVYSKLKKPFIEIYTLNNFKITLYQNSVFIRPKNQIDNCYLDVRSDSIKNIEFYGEFNFLINTNDLKLVKYDREC